MNSTLAKENPQQSVYTDRQAAKLAPQKLYLRIASMKSDEWPRIKAILLTQPGDTPVYLLSDGYRKNDAGKAGILVPARCAVFGKITLPLGGRKCYNKIRGFFSWEK